MFKASTVYSAEGMYKKRRDDKKPEKGSDF